MAFKTPLRRPGGSGALGTPSSALSADTGRGPLQARPKMKARHARSPSPPEDPIVDAGTYLAGLDPTTRTWTEYIVCSQIAGSVYVVANPELELLTLDLLEELEQYAIGSHPHDRPILVLEEAEEPVYAFENGVGGGPLPGLTLVDLLGRGGSMAASIRDSADRFEPYEEEDGDVSPWGFTDDSDDDLSHDANPFQGGWLRGGATSRRIKGKTGGAVVPVAHAAPPGAAETWVLRDPYDQKHQIGSHWKPSKSCRRLRKIGLDLHPKSGDVVVLELVKASDLASYKENRETDIQKAMDLTPRRPGGNQLKAAPPVGGLDALKDDLGAGDDDRKDPYLGAPKDLKGDAKQNGPAADAVAAPAPRIFTRTFGVDGVPRRELGEAVRSFTEDAVAKWPLTGPRSLLWVLMFICQQCQTSVTGRMHQLMQMAKLTFQDKYMTEYAVLARLLELAISFDQLHVTNLASMELAARRLQLIEEKYRFRIPQFDGGAGAADPENDHGLFLGLGTAATAGRTAIMVMPALTSFIGEELAKEAAVTKGKVKAHELRAQIRKLHGGKGPKDDI